ncbi:MAG TPA: hypothetical protein DCX64_04165 [Gammaproteobacteria bacterium]|jgi:hypothetical protein|nr:hypothetical protein [Gammaproteobacteria bacterium]HAY41451.1 hypothetical protein [Gammaproteobacteria bacterium]|tara:strand:+ start:2748 stop:3185 length:438 start_codon:yes stop_codon:yes gene_type:complete
MVKLSVSKAAKILGISRFEIQDQINCGKLHTHEGYVTPDSIRLAYPEISFQIEQDAQIKKMQKIKDKSDYRNGVNKTVHTENESALISVVASLKTKLYREEIKNKHFEMVFKQLNERLEKLNDCCHSQDKEKLSQIQRWIAEQAH